MPFPTLVLTMAAPGVMGAEGWGLGPGTNLLLQDPPEAELELRADLRDFHSRHDHEFATKHLARLVLVGELGRHTAVLAILIPAEPAVGDRLRTQKLEAAQERIFFRNFDSFLQHLDLY